MISRTHRRSRNDDHVQRILILGAGGHAQVVGDALLAMQENGQGIEVVGFVDDDVTLHGRTFLDLPVLGPLGRLDEIPHDSSVVAIGDNRTRARIADRLAARGERLSSAVHPSAVIARDVVIAPGAMICAGAVVNTASRIGAHAILNTGCTVDHHNVIGPCAHVAPGAHLGGEVTVGEGALVGIGASVAPRRHIGAWSIVGAGSTVIRDVPDGVTVVGVPARPLQHRRLV
jgi:sugar O-acyltransferase (sialic acid O-acetyltransferase NeuD family)